MNLTTQIWASHHRRQTHENGLACPKALPAYLLQAFSRLDALLVILLVGFLFVLLLPALASTQQRSERLQCLGNLRLIGRAFQMWGADHGDRRPWRVSESEGGTWRTPKVGNAWYEFGWVSNELATPSILACPSDMETRRIARDFSNSPDGGLLHFSYRNNAISYFLGLDTYPPLPMVALAGDRNLRVDGVNSGCSSGVINVAFVRYPPGNAAWTNSIHRFSGNVVFDDGHAIETSTAEMHKVMPRPYDGGGSEHLLMPK